MLSGRAALALLLMCVPVAQAALPEGGATMRVNGVRLELRTLVLPGEPEALARRLEGRWGERQSLPRSATRSRAALGRQRGPFHETLALSPGPRPGSSLGVIAVQDLREPPASMPFAPVPLPAAARVINVVQFGESGSGTAAFTIDAPGAPGGALERLWRAAAARGWQRIESPAVGRASGTAFWARRGARELTVVALPAAARTRIVMLVASDDEAPRR